MKAPTAAAVYARISSDQEGTGLGVKRQVQDCRKLAASLGWTVAEVYEDNDVSAYSGKRRPEYERMLTDLRDGLRDGVIVYHIDRLTRRPVELEQFVATMDAAGLRAVRFVVGDLDIGTGDGLLIARMLGAVAAHESATKSRRMTRKGLANAESGLPHRASTRAFGYEPDGVTIRESEAVIVRETVARFIAGESLRSLAGGLEDQGIPTVTGAPWRSTTLRRMLRGGRIAGLREYHREVIGPATWPGIITVEQRDQMLAVFDQRQRAGRRAVQTYLLTGLLRCGKCGGRLFSSPRGKERRYVCLSGPDHGGCGGIHVTAPPLEELIAQAVLYRLDSPELARALSGKKAADVSTRKAAEELSRARTRLEDLALMFGAGEISRAEYLAGRKPVEKAMKEAEGSLASRTGTTQVRPLVGQGTQLAASWETLSLGRQHAIVSAVLDHAVITPGRPGHHGLDPDRVHPAWRL